MAERRDEAKWLWLAPLLLLIFPALVLLVWALWAPREPTVTRKLSPQPPSIVESAPATSEEPEALEEPPPPAVVREPLPVQRGTIARADERPSSIDTAPAPSGELADEAIAAFDRETIAMLNSHKYWSKQGLADGLYDVWLNKKQQGVDVEDVRKQIAWALQGMFMEEY